MFVECLSSMDLLILFLLSTLLLPICTASASSGLILHTDYRENPHVKRSCIERQCPCGTQPRLCDVEGEIAKCERCPPGHFQKDEKSSRDIGSYECDTHRTCSEGW